MLAAKVMAYIELNLVVNARSYQGSKLTSIWNELNKKFY